MENQDTGETSFLEIKRLIGKPPIKDASENREWILADGLATMAHSNGKVHIAMLAMLASLRSDVATLRQEITALKVAKPPGA
jgi:hypothetical protein